MNTEPITPMIFRKWRDTGSVIAFMPTIPSDYAGLYVTSYEHVGQHGGADYIGLLDKTRPALPAEYANLKRELTQRGYRIKVIKRATQKHRQALLAELAQIA